MKRYVAALFLVCAATVARADETRVAVAANFTEPATEIAKLFAEKTGHTAKLSFGPSGQFFAQITQGAPFEVFLSADDARPRKAVEDGLAIPGTEFTYALGTLVLWSREPGLVTGPETLGDMGFDRLSIADPKSAPYGAAAVETMEKLGLYDSLAPRIVRGQSIAQAFQFVDTGNAELGFVALSQVIRLGGGSRWVVPADLHAPIRQDAVLLRVGASNAAAKAFLDFLRGPEAARVIESYGYARDPEAGPAAG
ncbi:molybdate ABC transporter substrate-binding protein [Amaricoccus solimangrovi]|uniref:Molybdate ABC transporter substrate-binding protein n=1 Tax=Amaricoccus solimangrovi TaxID=2589815 RepID=A0A501WQD4_9RHOB|nr:molybdate ABC transporter substrate-binding protein [Amaricoccus solimangrovi]TPE51679.1 molybdate ABC transporter substrate-binding protein [Amaricoccus solimangrovi]